MLLTPLEREDYGPRRMQPGGKVAWHLLAGEYPPQPGGVSDYTRLIAQELARRGAQVHVWAPGDAGEAQEEGVIVHRAPGLFTPAGLVGLTRGLARCQEPRRLLLQYVPHAFGLKAMNLPFCVWFAARRRDERWVFFHEVVYPWSPRDPLRHQVLAGTTRVMLRLVAGAADRTFVSIPTWGEHLPARIRRRTEWRPVPSNFPTEVAPGAVARVRAELGEGFLLGHSSACSCLCCVPLPTAGCCCWAEAASPGGKAWLSATQSCPDSSSLVAPWRPTSWLRTSRRVSCSSSPTRMG
jgi:hypothetical protein